MRKWREKNPEKLREYQAEYRKKNRDRINNLYNERYSVRYRKDPNFKIAKNLRNRMNKVLNGINKSASTLELLGVGSVSEFRDYIESLFQEGMTWGNHGSFGWHIDHRKPISSFDLTKVEEQKSAFHYTNLGPLWWKENLIKGKKIQC